MGNGQKSSTSPYLVTIVLMVFIAVMGVVGVFMLRPGEDNVGVITILLAFVSTIILNIFTLMKSQESVVVGREAVVMAKETHEAVNGQMSQFKQTIERAAFTAVEQVRGESFSLGREAGMTSANRRADVITGQRDQRDLLVTQSAQMVDNSIDALFSKDLHGIILSFNAAAERMFGYAASEIVGQSIAVLIPPDRANEQAVILNRIRRGELVDHYATVRVAKGGHALHVEVTISPMRAEDGAVIGAWVMVRPRVEHSDAIVTLATSVAAAKQELIAEKEKEPAP